MREEITKICLYILFFSQYLGKENIHIELMMHYCPQKKTKEHTYNKNYKKLSQKFTKIIFCATKIVVDCKKLNKIITNSRVIFTTINDNFNQQLTSIPF